MNKPLLTLAASIFDNVDAMLNELFTGDKPLADFHQRNASQKEKLEGYNAKALVHDVESIALNAKITELREQIRDLDTQRRTSLGQANAYRFRVKNTERAMRELAVKIERREDFILRKAIDKKVNAIGKKIVTNNGWRAKKDPANAGGVSLVDDDGKLPGGRLNPDSLVNKPADA